MGFIMFRKVTHIEHSTNICKYQKARSPKEDASWKKKTEQKINYNYTKSELELN